jgi:hypothetical protein
MTFNIRLTGIYTPPPPETRNLGYVEVDYNGNIYEWQLYIPNEVDLSAYVEAAADRVKAEIDAKEAEWATAPKTRTIDDPFGGEPTVVDVQKEEIVRPEIPDYYAKRRDAYPPMGEQLGAIFKGVDSADFQTLLTQIQAVKDMYPKP